MNYDPNLCTCGDTAKQTVKLIFGMWEYRAEKTVVVGGNCTGLTVIESAVGIVYDQLPTMSDGMGSMLPGIVLTRPGGGEENELHSTDDEEEGDEWLKDMLIGAEIVAIEPGPSLFLKHGESESASAS